METNKKVSFISAVVYLNNDERFVESFVRELHGFLDQNFVNFEIILVDDGSADKTADVIRSTVSKLDINTVTLVRLNNHQGYEAAMNAGVDLSNGDYVLEFETPILDYDLSLIMSIYAKSEEGYDIVSATNLLYKKNSSNMFYRVFNRGANLKYDVQSESFRLVSRRAINKINSMSNSIVYRKAFYANCGLSFYNVKYEGKKELLRYKTSKQKQKADVAATALILFTDISYKVSLGISIFMMLATVFMAIYAIVVFATFGAIEGFTTTMLVMTGSFFAVFLLFAIVIKYLSVICQMVFNKQSYRIESIERMTSATKKADADGE